MRDVSVLPKKTAVDGVVQLAVESTYPRSSVPGAAEADDAAMASSAEHAAAATVRRTVEDISSTRPRPHYLRERRDDTQLNR
jgi:hypothetical protein